VLANSVVRKPTSRNPLWAFAPGKASGRKSTCDVTCFISYAIQHMQLQLPSLAGQGWKPEVLYWDTERESEVQVVGLRPDADAF